jgi:hypothetical protein
MRLLRVTAVNLNQIQGKFKWSKLALLLLNASTYVSTHNDDNRSITLCGSYKSLTSQQRDILLLCSCLADSLCI